MGLGMKILLLTATTYDVHSYSKDLATIYVLWFYEAAFIEESGWNSFARPSASRSSSPIKKKLYDDVLTVLPRQRRKIYLPITPLAFDGEHPTRASANNVSPPAPSSSSSRHPNRTYHSDAKINKVPLRFNLSHRPARIDGSFFFLPRHLCFRPHAPASRHSQRILAGQTFRPGRGFRSFHLDHIRILGRLLTIYGNPSPQLAYLTLHCVVRCHDHRQAARRAIASMYLHLRLSLR